MEGLMGIDYSFSSGGQFQFSCSIYSGPLIHEAIQHIQSLQVDAAMRDCTVMCISLREHHKGKIRYFKYRIEFL